MSPRLEDCSPEVVEAIVILLDLRNICNLRLCSKTLAVKCTQTHLKSYFRTKHVDLTESGLRDLVDMTKSGRLGCLVQRLVLVGVVYDTSHLESMADVDFVKKRWGPHNLYGYFTARYMKVSDELREKAMQDLVVLKRRQMEFTELHNSRMDVRLLSEAFENIGKNRKSTQPVILSLDSVVYREDIELRVPPLASAGNGGCWEWVPIWQSAAASFHTVLQSLATSGLLIEKFDIFNDRRLQRCSLAHDELCLIDFKLNGLTSVLSSLKSLSISMSHEVLDTHGKWMVSHETVEPKSIGLVKLLQHSLSLEELNIHWYSLPRCPRQQSQKLLQDIVEADVLPGLKILELRGFHARMADLEALIRRRDLRKLSLDNIFLTSGRYQSIFDYCASDAASIEEIFFNDLREDRNIYFNVPGQPRFPWTPGYSPGPETLTRRGAEVKQSISYSTPSITDRPLGSPALHSYMKDSKKEYGPPDERYD